MVKLTARVIVTPKPVVNDPQGLTVKGGLHRLGLEDGPEVLVGKDLQLPLDARDRAPQPRGQSYARTAATRERRHPPGGCAVFVWGVNYESPEDRALGMWEYAQFDPGLIEQDFIRIKGLGRNTVRLFVQPVLRNDILGNNFRKLDLVVGLARAQGLYLILTFSDYVEPNLQAVQDVERRVAGAACVRGGWGGGLLRGGAQKRGVSGGARGGAGGGRGVGRLRSDAPRGRRVGSLAAEGHSLHVRLHTRAAGDLHAPSGEHVGQSRSHGR